MNEKMITLGRRAFISGTSLTLLNAARPRVAIGTESESAAFRFGLVTDMHYADKSPAGSRHYRETLAKLEEAASRFKEQDLQMVVELGDLIDAADSVDTEMGYLRKVNKAFATISPNRHYVLGNHCVDTLTKDEFLGHIEQPRSFYSFDAGPFHCIVLDACFRSDGVPYQRKNFNWTDANIIEEQLEWLQSDLKASVKPTIVFAHQRLDVTNSHGVKNAPQVRRILESSDNVQAVFQGHSHKNDLKEIGGINYVTMVAMVEGSGATNNGFSIVNLFDNGDIRIEGFRKQSSYDWAKNS